jgi:hypothetical protein
MARQLELPRTRDPGRPDVKMMAEMA